MKGRIVAGTPMNSYPWNTSHEQNVMAGLISMAAFSNDPMHIDHSDREAFTPDINPAPFCRD